MFKHFFENVRKPRDSFGGRLMLRSMNRGHEKLAVWARSFLNLQSNQVVLDLGCGGGRNIQYFLTQVSRVYGVDYSATSIDVASRLNRKAIEQGRCSLIEGEVSHLPFENESMDVVTAFETVYFWPDLECAFREIERVLKPGGTFLICNEGSDPKQPNIQKWAELLDFPVYTGEELSSLLQTLGFGAQWQLDQEQHLVVVATKSE